MKKYILTRLRHSSLRCHWSRSRQSHRNVAQLFSTTASMTSIDPTVIFANVPMQYLRAMDTSNFDQHTLQRTDVNFDVNNGKPLPAPVQSTSLIISQCYSDGSNYHVVWNDGITSKYSVDWVQQQTMQNWTTTGTSTTDNRVLWSGLTEEKVRSSDALCLSFTDAISDDGMKLSLRALYEYGFLLVTNTPIHDDGAGIAALASSLGGGCKKNNSSLLKHYTNGRQNLIALPHGTDGPLRTLYGTVWATTSAGQVEGTSVADSSYGHEGLPLHTDMTYRYDPPGLQIFTMIQPAVQGGESIFSDGFAAATQLRKNNPEAFRMLSQTVRRYRCIDYATGWHLEASGPIILVDNTDHIVMIRHNDLDRLPDLPPSNTNIEDSDNFFHRLQSAHFAWDQILADDDFRLVMRLQPGETIVVANQVRN
jgi:alpha-ketoglutarate-dependent taurine dioxygenase